MAENLCRQLEEFSCVSYMVHVHSLLYGSVDSSSFKFLPQHKLDLCINDRECGNYNVLWEILFALACHIFNFAFKRVALWELRRALRFFAT